MPESDPTSPSRAIPGITPGLVAGGSGLGATSLALANGPIWTILVVVAVGFLCTIVSTIFPQDSADRLTWWKEFWRHRRAGDQQKSGEKTNKSRRRLRKTAEGTEQPETT
jgi:hypothetical protein